MSSALACLGLAVSDDDEFNVLMKHAQTGICEIGTFGGVCILIERLRVPRIMGAMGEPDAVLL